MTRDDRLPQRSSRGEVNAFLRRVATTPSTGGGRLLFALDATASREPTWDRASHLQAEMFQVAAALGGLAIQVAWYRGFLEFEASPWCTSSAPLLERMTAVRCAAGQTQVGRVLEYAIAEHGRGSVSALVFVGDCVEESPDPLYRSAGQLGLLGVPAFMFLEGGDPRATQVFTEVARLSGGAFSPFDAGSAAQLRALLTAVAVYASGGRKALEAHGQARGGQALRLLKQLGRR
ncbi:MAG: VWA domain-containing protein [Gammaproteobacteria bacterium]|nr:MAG: VWA domain-containing protein [Gammaproteobacteria bacterium]